MTTLRVLPIEHDLLALTRAAHGMLPALSVRAVLLRAAEPKEKRHLAAGLTPDALASFRQTLARGGVHALLMRGAWRARPWASQPSPLEYTTATFELARWLTVTPLGTDGAQRAPHNPLAWGDELFLYLVASLLDEVGLPLEPLAPALGRSALAQLAFADGLAGERDLDPARVGALLDMRELLEGVQDDLVTQLVRRLGARQRRRRDPTELTVASGLAERRLDAFVDAALKRGRLDALRFIAEACTHWVEREPPSSLDPRATLQARQQARAAAAGPLRVAARVAREYENLRHVGFVDDEYDAAQALLAAWEPYAPALRRADEVARRWGAI